MLFRSDTPKAEIAYGVYDCLARTLSKMFTAAQAQHGELPFLVCGGVASSALLRTLLRQRFAGTLYFGEPALSADNAAGVALLGADRMETVWNN